tara:strand:- start:127 stop:462 length:336 start_codon:yes stop_codon:yes gene_type:complete
MAKQNNRGEIIMKETVTVYRFRDAFKQSDTYKNNFSYEGLYALFEYFEQLEDDICEEIELDVVAICCDYTEYDNLNDFNDDYKYQYTRDELEDETIVIDIPDTERFIIREF